MSIRFGLIGCGYISRSHLDALVRCKRAELAAVSDIQTIRMEEAVHYYHSQLGAERQVKHYGNYEEMLGDSEIDTIIIATISSLHYDICKKALLADKHVILEKPMALSVGEADHLIQLSKQQNKKLMICHQLRFRPLMQKMKDIIAEGKIGKPYLGVASIRINRTPDYYKTAAWRGSWETDGGMLVNQGIHLVDLLQWFLGDAKTVYGELSCQREEKETEDVALGIIHFHNQAKGIIEANIVTKPNNLGYSLAIFGDKGTISVEGSSLNKISRWFIESEETDFNEVNTLLKDNNEEVYMYDNFIDALSDHNKNILVDGIEGKKALEIIFGIYQSSLSQSPVKLPIKSFATVEMKNKEGRRK
ncbi:Gfo/Idh/MocA family oxidoreductase [Bacillus sp. FJAT-49736]|uniref:Gfo/Idh/MocA family protein n=1 Tax=Bacillus sp. FJAT-49736 TaxID=2833582 RepID=UPI001BC8D104|nr:Gfo/Idh/MocA family oxidoreductase [Bacillus sp. FJAT-49736]MBS4172211.1 Gfo/Idh/MocA family oxidoreductase [Bacillus sp. FJAT-49736]